METGKEEIQKDESKENNKSSYKKGHATIDKKEMERGNRKENTESTNNGEYMIKMKTDERVV